MRITKKQSEDNRRRVLDAATAQFRAKGFDNVAVAELMRAAGLTHGGFYNHFGSKDDLIAQACATAFAPGIARLEKIAALPDGPERRAALDTHAQRYLSPGAFDAAGPRCPMVAFGTDVTRQAQPAREAYAGNVRRYVEALTAAVASDAQPPAESRAAAILRLSALVGALSLARGVAGADRALADEILATVRDLLGRAED